MQYGDAFTADMAEAHGKILSLALNGTETVLTYSKVGERGRNRTYNLLIKSQLLCQLSYAPAVGI